MYMCVQIQILPVFAMFPLNFANCMTVWYFCFSFLFLVCTENHPPTVIKNLLGNNSPSPITRRISTLYSNFYFYCSIRCLNNIYGRLRGRDRTTKIDLQLPMQSVPITTNVASSNTIHGEAYSIQHYLIQFISDLRHVGLLYQ